MGRNTKRRARRCRRRPGTPRNLHHRPPIRYHSTARVPSAQLVQSLFFLPQTLAVADPPRLPPSAANPRYLLRLFESRLCQSHRQRDRRPYSTLFEIGSRQKVRWLAFNTSNEHRSHSVHFLLAPAAPILLSSFLLLQSRLLKLALPRLPPQPPSALSDRTHPSHSPLRRTSHREHKRSSCLHSTRFRR